MALDHGEGKLLLMLDLSAALDTVNHEGLLHKLRHTFGIHGVVAPVVLGVPWFVMMVICLKCQLKLGNIRIYEK